MIKQIIIMLVLSIFITSCWISNNIDSTNVKKETIVTWKANNAIWGEALDKWTKTVYETKDNVAPQKPGILNK